MAITVVPQLRVAEELAKRPNQTGKEEYNYVLSVIFPSNMLHILPYNRIVRDLGELSEEKFLEMVQENFLLEKDDRPVEPQAPHTFGMYISGQWYRLTAKPDTYPTDDPIHSLDVSILQGQPAGTGAGHRRSPDGSPDRFRRRRTGLSAWKMPWMGKTHRGLLPVSHVHGSADDCGGQGLVMPPKSTWFEPKLRDALTVHMIGDEQDGKNL